MLSVENLNVAIDNIKILNSVSLNVEKFSSIIGRNGAGKTTLIRSIMSILAASSGKINFNGSDLTKIKTYNMSKLGIGYMPEDRRLIPELSVSDNILIPVWALHKRNQDEELDKVLFFIPELKVMLKREAYKLSGGQQKLVALARAMIIGKKLLLLDEPFEGVAPALAERLVELISSLNRLDLITLITESDDSFSKKINAQIITIERGQIV